MTNVNGGQSRGERGTGREHTRKRDALSRSSRMDGVEGLSMNRLRSTNVKYGNAIRPTDEAFLDLDLIPCCRSVRPLHDWTLAGLIFVGCDDGNPGGFTRDRHDTLKCTAHSRALEIFAALFTFLPPRPRLAADNNIHHHSRPVYRRRIIERSTAPFARRRRVSSSRREYFGRSRDPLRTPVFAYF